MIGYRDMTFCTLYATCADRCDRALTEEVWDRAEEWWGGKGAPVVQFIGKPSCWRELDKEREGE